MDPSGSRVAVRGATIDDAADLERIETVSFDGDRLSRRSLNHHLHSPTCDVLAATLDKEIVGYALMFYRRTTRRARLYTIATLPKARGQGVARALMNACEKAAQRRGCSDLRLEVRIDNEAAIRLYRRLGYQEFGRHLDYYHDGQSALRFEKPISARTKVAAA